MTAAELIELLEGIDPESLGHLVAARGLTEEAVVRLGKVKVRPWA